MNEVSEVNKINKINKLLYLQDANTTTSDSYYLGSLSQLNVASSRTEVLSGRDFLVIPVVILVSKVVKPGNTDVSIYAPAEVLEQSVSLWDSTQVIVNHPDSDSDDAEGNSIQTLFAKGLGTLSNTKFVNNKLTSEIWIDTELTASKEDSSVASTYEKLSNNEQCEVSVGVYTSLIAKEGTYEGEDYGYEWTTISPLHLAVLDGFTGACSNEDGCGTMQSMLNNPDSMVVSKKSTVTLAKDCECANNDNSQNYTKSELHVINLFASSTYSDEKETVLRNALKSKHGSYVYLYSYSDTDVIFELYDEGEYSYSYYTSSYLNVTGTSTVEFSDFKKVLLTTKIIELFQVRKDEMTTNLTMLNDVAVNNNGIINSNGNYTTTNNNEDVDMDLTGMNFLQAIEEIKKSDPSLAAEMQVSLECSTAVKTAIISKLSVNPSCMYDVATLNTKNYKELVGLQATIDNASKRAVEAYEKAQIEQQQQQLNASPSVQTAPTIPNQNIVQNVPANQVQANYALAGGGGVVSNGGVRPMVSSYGDAK